jgi:hypothetical protein
VFIVVFVSYIEVIKIHMFMYIYVHQHNIYGHFEPFSVCGQVHSKDEEFIVSFAVSGSAHWLAYATPTRLRLYRLGGCSPSPTPSAPSPTLTRVKGIWSSLVWFIVVYP